MSTYHPDYGMDADSLRKKYGGWWSDHPDFPPEDWQHEVAEGNTRLSYWEWLVQEINQWEPE